MGITIQNKDMENDETQILDPILETNNCYSDGEIPNPVLSSHIIFSSSYLKKFYDMWRNEISISDKNRIFEYERKQQRLIREEAINLMDMEIDIER